MSAPSGTPVTPRPHAVSIQNLGNLLKKGGHRLQRKQTKVLRPPPPCAPRLHPRAPRLRYAACARGKGKALPDIVCLPSDALPPVQPSGRGHMRGIMPRGGCRGRFGPARTMNSIPFPPPLLFFELHSSIRPSTPDLRHTQRRTSSPPRNRSRCRILPLPTRARTPRSTPPNHVVCDI